MKQSKGSNIQQLRLRNRAVILKMICTTDKMSRIELSKKAGLTKMTLSNIAGELLENGVLREYASDYIPSVGRRPILLDISETSPVVIGIQIARDACKGIVADAKLHSWAEEDIPLEAGETEESLLAKLRNIIRSLQKKTQRQIIGIGVACMGPLDSSRGRLLDPPNFYGIHDVDITRSLEAEFGLPVFFENDMNASALAELHYGCGKHYGDYIFLGLTNGVGAGIVSSGAVLKGEYGISGEIGHTTVQYDGPLCSCGRKGCLETYVSVPVLLQKARILSGDQELRWEDFMLRLRKENDPLWAVLNDTIEPLAAALANAVNLLDSRLIIIGQEGVHLPLSYLLRLEEKINRLILARRMKSVRIVCSTFGESAPLLGSAALAVDELLFKIHTSPSEK